MSIHWRSGFWRTSINGNLHWVSGHDVDRGEWESGSYQKPNESLLRQARAHSGATARLVRPNGECPVCKQPVFFYQNANGSRVFFDELGPPWPKHPCTAFHAQGDVETAALISPTYKDLRAQDEFEFVQIWAGDDADLAFRNRYGIRRWDIAVVGACYSNENTTVLVLNGAAGTRYFVARNEEGLHLPEGHLVTFAGSHVSFLSPTDLHSVEMRLDRASAKRALHHVVGIELLSDTAD